MFYFGVDLIQTVEENPMPKVFPAIRRFHGRDPQQAIKKQIKKVQTRRKKQQNKTKLQ